jgi:Flp pilus assembly protein TadB
MFEKIKKYILTNIELQKLSAVEKIALIMGAIAAASILVIFFLIAVLFLSVGLCLYISNLFGDNYSGFLIMGGVYLLLAVIAYLLKDSMISKPVANSVIRMMFKKAK